MEDSSERGEGRTEGISKPELKPGCRVQLSRLGIERCPKLRTRTGTILSEARNANGFRVQFDGAKSPQSLHRTYIMPIEQNGSCDGPHAN
jgi:hypothetical protein